jgi:U4/U6.U5 tri-snRNP-associated protein 2
MVCGGIEFDSVGISFISLDLPATPLFKDSQGGNIIPQVPLFTVFEKFNGEKITVSYSATI